MSDWNAVSAFMANVVVWPVSPQDPGYINLHYSMEDRTNPKRKIVTGWPTRDLNTFFQKVAWSSGTNYIKDLWFCTSLQSQAGKNSKGNPKAIRGATLATKQKSIWVDIDVEPDNPKKYGTQEEALKALLLFASTVKLPAPSAIVFSGGGIHVYWISKDPLTPAEWQGYASGLKTLLLANALKCDSGLTTDIARILRVPGTLNHKYDPPRKVELSTLPLVLYDFEKDLSFLKGFATPSTAPKAGHILFAEGADMASFKRGPAFKIENEPGLEAGIDKFSEQLLDFRPIFKECGFLRHAFKTGGADYDNPLWNLSVLCSTFMENGNAIAHEISKGHPSYSKDDTQAQFDRKMVERHDRGLGYPQCTTIQGAGCKSCASCPLLSKGKSPLNIRPVVTATVNPAAGQSAAAQQLELPDGFDVDDRGIICKVIEKTTKTGESVITMTPLFQVVLTKFWAQKHPDALNYTVTVDKGFTHDASVPHGEMSRTGFRAYLAGPEARTLVTTVGAPYLEEFYLSMLGKLRAAAAAQQAIPFGWFRDAKGAIRGFSYGGQVLMDDGTIRPCGTGEARIKKMYTPCGDIADWYAAAKTVTDRKRPELTSIMLLSFASPLMALDGHRGMLMSMWGDSAAGKSSAYTVGMAVWGDPLLTKGSETSTRNNITTQMAEIRHLPFYWDEIQDDKHRETVAALTHELTDGVQKGRNESAHKTAARGTWQLIIAAASNKSFREFLHNKNQQHLASFARVMEWEVKRIDGGPGHMSDSEATALLAELEHSYGMMGMKYAHFLAQNHAQIKAELHAKSKEIENIFGKIGLNRYWLAGAVCMSLAAKYAQQLGVDVDPAEIEKFMKDVMYDNIHDMAKYGLTEKNSDNPETALARYFKDREAKECMIWTDRMHNTRGKPSKGVTLLKGPTQAKNTSGGIHVRWAVENRECIVAYKDFTSWAQHPDVKLSLARLQAGMQKHFGAQFGKTLQIASHTNYATGSMREDAFVIPIPGPHSPLWDYLVKPLNVEERALLEEKVVEQNSAQGGEDVADLPDENSEDDLGFPESETSAA